MSCSNYLSKCSLLGFPVFRNDNFALRLCKVGRHTKVWDVSRKLSCNARANCYSNGVLSSYAPTTVSLNRLHQEYNYQQKQQYHDFSNKQQQVSVEEMLPRNILFRRGGNQLQQLAASNESPPNNLLTTNYSCLSQEQQLSSTTKEPHVTATITETSHINNKYVSPATIKVEQTYRTTLFNRKDGTEITSNNYTNTAEEEVHLGKYDQCSSVFAVGGSIQSRSLCYGSVSNRGNNCDTRRFYSTYTSPFSSCVDDVISQRKFSTSKVTMSLKTLQIEKSQFSPPEDLGLKVPVEEVRRYMVDCLTSVGVTEDNASQMANVLVAADTRGHFSHGLNRLEMYVNDVRANICNGNAAPTIEKQSVSTGLVVGNNGLGPVVGNFSMDLAIAKAKETGIGWVCSRGSNHYGIAGWYAMRASQQGLLGMSFTNTSPLVAPTRAKKPALGTNPIALAAPAAGGDPFVLDMATCTVAVGKIEVCRRKEVPIPEGWALDSDGVVTTDASKAMVGALMPLGGSETNSGYKGYGLAMMVEIFCGLLSGGAYGPNVRRWMDTTKEADLGQCFVAIDPTFFAPGFPDRMADLMNHCRDMEPATPGSPVLAAGDPERAHIKKVEAESGLTYHLNQITDSWKLANVLKVKPMAGV